MSDLDVRIVRTAPDTGGVCKRVRGGTRGNGVRQIEGMGKGTGPARMSAPYLRVEQS